MSKYGGDEEKQPKIFPFGEMICRFGQDADSKATVKIQMKNAVDKKELLQETKTIIPTSQTSTLDEKPNAQLLEIKCERCISSKHNRISPGL